MNPLDLRLMASILSGTPEHNWGVAAFAGVYVLLLVWLCLLPERLLGEPADRPWWKSSRHWAIGITILQIAVYLSFG